MKTCNAILLGSPIALGLAGAILGWLVNRSRQPVKVPVRKR
jgi:hypothetical protein